MPRAEGSCRRSFAASAPGRGTYTTAPMSAPALPPPNVAARGTARRWFWPAVLLLVAGTSAAHLPSAWRAHFEGDEQVFLFLAERLRSEPARYSLQGPLQGPAAQRFIAETWSQAPLFQAGLVESRNPALASRLRDHAGWLRDLRQAEVLFEPPRRDPGGAAVDYRRPAYDPQVYDRPFFFHPPVFPYLLAASRIVAGAAGAAALPIAAHALTILLTALIAQRLAGDFAGAAAALLIAVDPISYLCAERIWIDGPLQAAVCLAVLAALRAARSRSCAEGGRSGGAGEDGGGGEGPGGGEGGGGGGAAGGAARHFAAGLCCGLALLTKMPAVLTVPAILYVLRPPAAATGSAGRRAWLAGLICWAAGAAALVLPWLLITRLNYGAFLPAAHPSEWLVQNFPYVRMLVNRPWYFYPVALLLAAPVYALAVPAAFAALQRRELRPPLIWAAGVLGGMLLLGGMKWGFQLRYIAPAMPALAILVAAWLCGPLERPPGLPRLLLLAATAVLAAIGLLSGVKSVAPPPMAEVLPWVLEQALLAGGRTLSSWWPGMW